MIRRFIACLICLLAGAAFAHAADTDLPRGNGLPVAVDAAVAFVDLQSFDENAGLFRATVDVRLRWKDLRLASPDAAGAPPQTLTDNAAKARLKTMWAPPIKLANQIGKAADSDYALRFYADGKVELINRVTADFRSDVDVGRFPFDRQSLGVKVRVDGPPISEISLRITQDDLDFSRPARDARLNGWSVGSIDMKSEPVAGWYNVMGAQVVTSLEIVREPGLIAASIFIPLIASLLIPLLAIWLNRIEDGLFQVDTFELVNIIIGGLFAVIALNFTVYSTYGALADSDNTVNRLFALNYTALAVALSVNIIFARFNFIARLFGPYVQEQAYIALMWLIPLVTFVLAASFLLVAYV